MDVYKKLKRQNGEKFAQTLRNHHSGLLEIPNITTLLRHAGRDAAPLLPYLLSLMIEQEGKPYAPPPSDPFALLDEAGYDAFHADTLDGQNSIKRYFKPGELLCTFRDAARFANYHIVHAVKKDVNEIRREDFYGIEARQDAYGTSVISIQMSKRGGFISIKNRYNHTVGSCDHTFDSNPDNIIPGLSEALRTYFNVDFTANKTSLPGGFVRMGNQILKYDREVNNIYYAEGAWAQNGRVHELDKSAGDGLFDTYRFDNKTKRLTKIDNSVTDPFLDDFNRCYGGNKNLHVRDGNLTLNGEIVIGAERGRIKTLHLPGLTKMSDRCLKNVPGLTHFSAPDLVVMGSECLHDARTLTHFDAPSLIRMDNGSLHDTHALTRFYAPSLETMGRGCLYDARALAHFDAPALTTMDSGSLRKAYALSFFGAPLLTTVGRGCLHDARSLEDFDAPSLVTMGRSCLYNGAALTRINVPAMTMMHNDCLHNAPLLESFDAPSLAFIGDNCLHVMPGLVSFRAPVCTKMGRGCLSQAPALESFETPALLKMGRECLYNVPSLKKFEAQALTRMGHECLYTISALVHFNTPALAKQGNNCFGKTRPPGQGGAKAAPQPVPAA